MWTSRQIKSAGPSLRVLVVDDNVNAAEALGDYLSFEDIECRVVFGGVEAISVATQWRPQAIIMDVSMPECNGIQAAGALRDDPRTQDIAIIAFTALDETEVRRLMTHHEFDAYCQKGLAPSKLVSLLKAFQQGPHGGS